MKQGWRLQSTSRMFHVTTGFHRMLGWGLANSYYKWPKTNGFSWGEITPYLWEWFQPSCNFTPAWNQHGFWLLLIWRVHVMTVGWYLEFKSWKGTIRYPAPPQELWNTTQRELANLCRENNIPQLPDFEHKYLAALFAAMGAPITQQVERAEFFVSDKQAIWLLRLRWDNPPVMSTAWHFTYPVFPWDGNGGPFGT